MPLIKLTSLQLHHHMSLIKLTSITSLHFNYSTCSKLITAPNSITFYPVIITLHHSRIPSPSLVTIHQAFSFHIQHPPSFDPFIYLSSLPSQTTFWILRNYCFCLATSKLIQGRDQLVRIQYFAPYAHRKLIEGFNKKRHLHPPLPTVMLDVIKPEMVLLSTKLATQNLVVSISCGNVLNMALVSPRLSFHLLQSTSYLTVFLLQVNCALFVQILFVVATLT